MKKWFRKFLLIIILLIQMINTFPSFVRAQINENDEIKLLGDHECDSLVEYYMEDYNKWSYKIVYYVYYNDDGKKYPAFCVEPAKQGVGTGYDEYSATIKKVENMYSNGEERLNQIWRILMKGYMGRSFESWNLECDDDLYSATKIALHSLSEGIAPEDKYVLGDRSVDGNTIEDIQRRGEKVLDVAIELYYYGLNGKETYQKPIIEINEDGESEIEIINDEEYYTQKYFISTNKELESYDITINDFPEGTVILNSDKKNIKIAIPTKNINKDINGKILIQNAYIKTNPIYYCESENENSQNYVTYNNPYELAKTSINLNIKANKSKLFIKKVDKETEEALSGIKFTIFDENKNKIKDVTTNENGEVVLDNLYPQTIYVKETQTKKGYKISDEEKKVILEYGKTSNVYFENEQKKGQIKVVKVDKDNNKVKLEGVEFEVLDEKENVLEKLITNKEGEALTKKYSLRDYTKLKIREVKTKEEYVLNDEIEEVVLEEGKIKDIIFENEKIKGQIEITKHSEDDNKINNKPKGSPLEGVEIQIFNENNELVETLVTDENGKALSKELLKGKYFLKEIRTNEEYELSNEIIEVEIMENNKKEKIEILNKSKEPELPKLPRTGF